jgi:aminopeptidase N
LAPPATSLHSAVGTDAESVTSTPVEYFRRDYQPLPFTVDQVALDFVIRDGRTTVTTKMTLVANPRYVDEPIPLVLDGDETCLQLRSVRMNGQELREGVDYELAPGRLLLKTPVDGAVVQTVVDLVPEENTQLSGLYKDEASAMYCTQCEAMGFRRITYYPDRPDNMATFTSVRLEADKERYPILLSNGNRLDQGTVPEDDSRHYAIWSDPFPKPSYLFAAVVGKLGSIRDSYTTVSGKKVQLEVFSEPRNVHKLSYAMESLQRSMQWDEQRFGLEYDLELYNVVAVDSFNMGAMENKGLNVFNTAYVLADEGTATDTDFERVEGVIGHEYFHNWTGNRVTCRDWFQLTLKEGLTVFRDQEFSGDMNSKPVKRIEDVRVLRARQFSEDAGPMSHPIRPESYISMDNFYTGTVYIKGAEVIRMYQTILTPEGFNKGMKLYFERHDGSAVTCDDFLAAMADANNVDLTQFALWYSTPGTPTVQYETSYADGTFTLKLSQSSRSVTPMHIPVAFGLLDKVTGQEVVPTTVLELKEASQVFTFDGLEGDVVPSLLRDFSAPVKLEPVSGEVDESDLAFLAARDTDGFNRWDAGQRLYTSLIFQTLNDQISSTTQAFVDEAFRMALEQKTTDYSIQAYALTLPSESTLSEEMKIVDPVGLHEARGKVKKALARKYESEIRTTYDGLTETMQAETEFKVDAEAIGRRRLRNTLLEYLCSIRETDQEQIAAAELAMKHFQNAKGMTDKIAGLGALASMDGEGADARDEAMQTFYDDAEGDALVLNKWFMTQAVADLPDVLNRVKKLKEHPDFTLKNPNRCRSLISAFAMNSAAFHDESGEGYKFLGSTIAELDKLNPQISSRMASSLIQWRRYDEERGQLMKAELEKLNAMKLSEDLFEIVSRGLKD